MHFRIVEGEKERIQIFSGTVLAKRHQGLGETFTVRRIVQGEGVERVFPVHSPRLAKVEIKRRGKVRRAKLNYLRDRVGRATKVKELVEKGKSKNKSKKKKEPVVEPPQKKPEEKVEKKAEEEAASK